MSEWWSYRLSDFLMFTADTYWRMFELHHRAWWPLQSFWAAVAALLLYACLRPQRRQRLTIAVLAAAWLFLAWAFFATRYAQILPAAAYIAWFAAAQAALLAILSLTVRDKRRAKPRRRFAGVLLVHAIAIHPVLVVGLGRDWRQIEWFGMTPDVTALATIAVVATSDARWRRWALPIPLLWLLTSAATLWTMRLAEFWSLIAGLLLAIVVAWGLRRQATLR